MRVYTVGISIPRVVHTKNSIPGFKDTDLHCKQTRKVSNPELDSNPKQQLKNKASSVSLT